MTQLHLTMQSLVFGSDSLVNRVRRALLAKQYVKERKISWKEAMRVVGEVSTKKLIREIGDDWQPYLTLLNLRNWDTLGGRPVTEQIYIHSKLLIADDRTVVLGSANINDRSQMGDRDSELAVIMHDDAPVSALLDGKRTQQVGASAHGLRKALWRKHFGLMGAQLQQLSFRLYWIDRPPPKLGKQYRELRRVMPAHIKGHFRFFRN
ncbi:phospholipase D-like domain-containing protein [Cupriavidus basilensis]